MTISRRTFLKRVALSGITAATITSGTGKVLAQAAPVGNFALLHDLEKCDGCSHLGTPYCVNACRTKNQNNFPEPEGQIEDYWPQKSHEDWSDKKGLTNRLTPYNWTYVQHLEVKHNGKIIKVHIPRKCMHCDNPPCSTLCPFGVNDKTPEGPVVINPNGCFGGAKCREVCPWHIPQRQAGVGLYLKVAPTYAGGGVMYKCDMCYDLIVKGQQPACVSACPHGAIRIGDKQEIKAYALKWAQDNNGYIYGDVENGGTSNFYLSKVPFEAINKAIMEQDMDGKPGKINMSVNLENPLNEPDKMMSGFMLAPVAGVLAAGISAYNIMKGGGEDEN